MSSFWEIVFFWTIFGILVALILPKYYFGTGKKKIKQLRYSSIVLQLAALPLLLFSGKLVLVFYGLVLAVSIAFVAFGKPAFNKIGAVFSLAGSVLLIIILALIFPGTKRLTAADLPLIGAAIFMLANNVAVLLLWHQLQKRKQ